MKRNNFTTENETSLRMDIVTLLGLFKATFFYQLQKS